MRNSGRSHQLWLIPTIWSSILNNYSLKTVFLGKQEKPFEKHWEGTIVTRCYNCTAHGWTQFSPFLRSSFAMKQHLFIISRKRRKRGIFCISSNYSLPKIDSSNWNIPRLAIFTLGVEKHKTKGSSQSSRATRLKFALELRLPTSHKWPSCQILQLFFSLLFIFCYSCPRVTVVPGLPYPSQLCKLISRVMAPIPSQHNWYRERINYV
jgi:hypothetical protein